MRNLAESKRKCRFPDEGDMMYYRNYTRNNCMLECVHRFIQEACGCQPYFHPSEDWGDCPPHDDTISEMFILSNVI